MCKMKPMIRWFLCYFGIVLIVFPHINDWFVTMITCIGSALVSEALFPSY